MSDGHGTPDPTDRIETTFLTAGRSEPENYVRIQVTKGAKEYRSETTVSLRWDGSPEEGADQLQQLLRVSDDLARDEIQRREYEDAIATQGDQA